MGERRESSPSAMVESKVHAMIESVFFIKISYKIKNGGLCVGKKKLG
jgi:hypothetical protein